METLTGAPKTLEQETGIEDPNVIRVLVLYDGQANGYPFCVKRKQNRMEPPHTHGKPGQLKLISITAGHRPGRLEVLLLAMTLSAQSSGACDSGEDIRISRKRSVYWHSRGPSYIRQRSTLRYQPSSARSTGVVYYHGERIPQYRVFLRGRDVPTYTALAIPYLSFSDIHRQSRLTSRISFSCRRQPHRLSLSVQTFQGWKCSYIT